MNFQKVSEGFNAFHEWVARKTGSYLETKIGGLLLSIVIFAGPIVFLPTLYNAWTAPNIDAFRTATWPVTTLVNFVFWISLAREGRWQPRLAMILWVILLAATTIATWVR